MPTSGFAVRFALDPQIKKSSDFAEMVQKFQVRRLSTRTAAARPR